MSTSQSTSMTGELSVTPSDSDEAYCVACNQSFSLDQIFCPKDGSKLIKLRSSPDQLVGRVFDQRYELRSVLGQGGMGTVYRAWQRSVDREVAVKVIHPKLATEREVAKRFLREARLASRLNQQNIVSVYDFGQTDDGILYLVMELLQGRSLAHDLAAGQPLPPRRITAIAAQVCDALEAAHRHGIIHRDLKPHNILVLDEPAGRDAIKILDFGLAKSLIQETSSLVTQSDALLGTPAYISPEQILGKPVDPRSDLYSLGCILYKMASGRPPFRGETMNAVLAMHLRTAPPPLPESVPPTLAAIIEHLMAKNPDDRPASAALVHAGLTSPTPSRISVSHEPTLPSPILLDRTIGYRRARRIAATAAIAIGIAAVAVAAIALRPKRRIELDAPAGSMSIVPANVRPGTPVEDTRIVRPPHSHGSAARPSAAGAIEIDAPVAATAPEAVRTPAEPTNPAATGAAAAKVASDEMTPHAASLPARPTTRPRPRSDATTERTKQPKPREVRAVPVDSGLPDLDLIPTARRTSP